MWVISTGASPGAHVPAVCLEQSKAPAWSSRRVDRGTPERASSTGNPFVIPEVTGTIGPFTTAPRIGRLSLSSFRGRAVRLNVPRLV
jgi:hypothetical protein